MSIPSFPSFAVKTSKFSFLNINDNDLVSDRILLEENTSKPNKDMKKKIKDKEKTKEIINTCIEELNNKLKLNVPIKCSIDFGTNYADCH